MFVNELEDVNPLLGIGWPRDFNWMIRKIESTTTTTDQPEKYKTTAIFKKLLKMNQTYKDPEFKAQLKPGHTPRKQKSRPIPKS